MRHQRGVGRYSIKQLNHLRGLPLEMSPHVGSPLNDIAVRCDTAGITLLGSQVLVVIETGTTRAVLVSVESETY